MLGSTTTPPDSLVPGAVIGAATPDAAPQAPASPAGLAQLAAALDVTAMGAGLTKQVVLPAAPIPPGPVGSGAEDAVTTQGEGEPQVLGQSQERGFPLADLARTGAELLGLAVGAAGLVAVGWVTRRLTNRRPNLSSS